MRADKRKSIDKVSAALVKNPLATQEELGKATGMNKGTVSRAMPQVQQIATKDDRIINLTETDFEIVQLTQKRTKKQLEDESTKITARDLTYVGDVAAKRYQIFRGDITNKDGGLKNTVKDLTTEELLKITDE